MNGGMNQRGNKEEENMRRKEKKERQVKGRITKDTDGKYKKWKTKTEVKGTDMGEKNCVFINENLS